MPKSRRLIGNAGQAMVEVAIAMVGITVMVIGLLQLLMFCRNQLIFQRMVEVASVRVDHKTSSGTRPYHWWSKELWGNIFRPLISVSYSQNMLIPGWKPYRGVSVTGASSHQKRVTVGATLFPLGMENTWTRAGQISVSDVLVEPAPPRGGR